MRRTALIILALMLIAAIGVTAQGNKCCPRKGQGGPAQAVTRPGVCPAGGPGMGMGAGMGGWWTKVQPQTPQQKQFVSEITALHNRIRAEQMELNQLKASRTNPVRAAALEKDLAALRTRVHELMWNNQALMQQMGINCQMGRGACGPNPTKCAQCPNKDTCPCYASGTCNMDPAKCAACPNKDKCPCYQNAGQRPGCPALKQPAAPQKK